MTYCVGMVLNEGIIMAADTRTNAGVDHVATFPKLFTFEVTGERVIMIATSGNLATAQRVTSVLRQQIAREEAVNLHTCDSMFQVAELAGEILLASEDHYRAHNPMSAVDFSSNLLVGGQIKGQAPEMYHIYPEGNFIRTSVDTPFFQIGESKYGKPILDRIITNETPLNQAMKCALISFDSTMHSNLSVGMPIDIVVYRADSLETKIERLEQDDRYFNRLAMAWGSGLRNLFDQLP
ncbi:MAG: peptidase [Gammaproteobacteria bacterium BRH_c0]|nr:MAG: peptidase [Gammaproteobacteria bacterium BRH_c0]